MIVDLTREQDRLRPAAAVRREIFAHKLRYGLAVVLQRFVEHLDVLANKVAAHKMQHNKAALRSAAEADGVRISKCR